MIAEQYINEGIRIRKTYISNLKEILKKEPLILEKKKVFEKLQIEVESVVNSDLNEIRKTLELTNKMIGLEKEIKAIQDIIKPFYDVIENLKNDKDTLYLAIIEKYPNITQQEIEREIMSNVLE
jgi:hypothetical protein